MKNFSILAHHMPEDISKLQDKEWYISRKYNGINAFWDGGISRGRLASDYSFYHRGRDKENPVCTGMWSIGRNNRVKVISCPSSFTDSLPKGVPLQGELWVKDNLQLANSIVKKYDPDKWKLIKFVVYGIKPYCLWELPKEQDAYLKKTNKYYENRPWKELMDDFVGIDNSHQYIKKPTFFQRGNQKLEDLIEHVKKLAEGYHWEGFMLQNINANYECKRSHNLLKWKPFYDSEATVISYNKTDKKEEGSITCELVWDDKILSIHGGKQSMVGKKVIFKVGGLTLDECSNLSKIYPIGSEISFTFNSVSVYGTPMGSNVKRGI